MGAGGVYRTLPRDEPDGNSKLNCFKTLGSPVRRDASNISNLHISQGIGAAAG